MQRRRVDTKVLEGYAMFAWFQSAIAKVRYSQGPL